MFGPAAKNRKSDDQSKALSVLQDPCGHRVRALGVGGGRARFCPALRGAVPGREAMARPLRLASAAALVTGEWSPEREDYTWLETAFCDEFLKRLSWFGGMEYEWRAGPRVHADRFLGAVVVERTRGGFGGNCATSLSGRRRNGRPSEVAVRRPKAEGRSPSTAANPRCRFEAGCCRNRKGALHCARDSEHHLRLVGHAGGRSARRLAGDQLCPAQAERSGDEPGAVPGRVLPPLHDLLRPARAARPAAAIGELGFTAGSGRCRTRCARCPMRASFLSFAARATSALSCSAPSIANTSPCNRPSRGLAPIWTSPT